MTDYEYTHKDSACPYRVVGNLVIQGQLDRSEVRWTCYKVKVV